MQRFSHLAEIDATTRIPYSPKPRHNRDRWALVFNDPTTNKRVQLTTQHLIGNRKSPPDEFFPDAVRLIRDHIRPPSLFPSLTPKGWDELIDLVLAKYPTTRDETARGYRAAKKAIQEVFPDVLSPNDISEEKARKWVSDWLAVQQADGSYRSPVTADYYRRALSSLMERLKVHGQAQGNPWLALKIDKPERVKKPVPKIDQIGEFFAYLAERFPGWDSLVTLFQTKLVTGCRTSDLCQLRAADLCDGRLTYRAATSKTKTTRVVPIPPDLLPALQTEAARGVFLWEGVFADMRTFRKQSNGLPPAFKWQTVRVLVNNVTREYSDSRPGKPRLTPHGFRRRAITSAVKATGSEDKGAFLMGVLPETARAHYTDAEEAFGDEAAQIAIGADLLRLAGPKRDQTESGTNKTTKKQGKK